MIRSIFLGRTAPVNDKSFMPFQHDYLLFLRGYMAFLVVIGHGLSPIHLQTEFFSLNGAYPVMVFFGMSGYLMSKIINNKYNYTWGVWDFYWNRINRIFPLYYLALLVGGNRSESPAISLM
jgi:peptidoglycan/LPS O-acetylase OafA/YrhL